MGGILAILAGLAIVALLRLFNPGKKAELNDSSETENDGDNVLKALLSALSDLQRQKAGGYRCWITSCIERAQMGFIIPPDVAVCALKKTRDEISGPRFVKDGFPTVYYDLSALDAAIADVENKMRMGA